jgi:multidrug efflux pump subunit AcrA (membrane-fusion protein)
VGLVALGAVVAWFARGALQPAAPAAAVTPATAQAVAGPPAPASTVMAGGRVESSTRRELSFGMPGVLAAVHVERGSVVKAGDLLMELEADAERADVAQAQAAADAARARLDELKEGARPEELDQARRDAEAAVARAADAKEKSVQAETLVAAGATTKSQALEAQRAAEAEGARARSALSRVAMLERGTRQTSLTAATAELARARAQLAQAQARLGLKRLLAPFDGTVVEVRSHAGEASGIEVPPPIILADLAHLEVKVDVPEAKATLVRAGQPAAITVEALAATAFKGHVSSVGLEADRQKGTLEVTVAFDPGSPLEQVRPRMAARVAIDVKRP